MKYDKGLSYAILQKGSEKLIVKELFFEGNQIKNLNIFKKKYSISYFSNKIKYQKDRKNNLFYSDNFESDSLVLTEKNGYIFSAKWICAEGL